MNNAQPARRQSVTPPHGLPSLRIWQQNVNKSLEAHQDMLNNLDPRHVDVVAIQEPYIDFQGYSRGNSHWFIVYPPNHRTLPTRTRSLLLINRRLDSDTWRSLEISLPDITGVQIASKDGHNILLYNVYNNQDHNRTIHLLRTHTRDARA